MAAADLTAQRLRELLDYNPDTGTFTWRVDRHVRAKAGDQAGGLDISLGYWKIGIDGKGYRGHRLAWLHVHGEWPKWQIDHINGVRSDNRIVNLRDVPPLLNKQNRVGPSKAASGFRGVSKMTGCRGWRAEIKVKYKGIHLGIFDTPEEAHAAYLDAKRKLHDGCTI
jgi:hypothetical protein